MEFYELFGFLIILKESVKILPKNGKLMAFIAIFSVILTSSFFLLFNYSLQSLVVDMFVTFQQSFMPNPSSFDIPDSNSFSTADNSSFTPQTGFNPAGITGQLGHLKEDMALLFAVQNVFMLAFSIISFFSSIATVLVSAMSHDAKSLSLKDLFSRIVRTWTRPLITSLYVSGLAIGYFAVVVMLVAPLLMYPTTATISVAVFVAIVAFIIFLYLFVAWALAIVVSVVEESCYGMEALAKAASLVKGKRLHGFLLLICFNLIVYIIFQGYKMIFGDKVFLNPTIYGLLILNVTVLVKLFLVVAYTVLYFQCKKHHGEEIELHGSLEYTKLPTTQ